MSNEKIQENSETTNSPITADFSFIVSKIIDEIRIGLTAAELEQQKDLLRVRRIVEFEEEREEVVTDADIDMFLKLQFPLVSKKEVDTSVKEGFLYNPGDVKPEDPPIEKTIGYKMRKGEDFILDRGSKKHIFTRKGIESIRSFTKKQLERERREVMTILAKKGYPQIEVESFSISLKAIVSHPKLGEITVKMPEKLTNDIRDEKGNLISEIRIDLRTRKESLP